MSTKPFQLESYHIHTGLTDAERILLLNQDFTVFIQKCLHDLIEKQVIKQENECFQIESKFLKIIKRENDESQLLIEFAKQNVILYAYEIPLLKLMNKDVHLTILINKAKIIEKVFYDWIDFRMRGFDIEATKSYYQKIN